MRERWQRQYPVLVLVSCLLILAIGPQAVFAQETHKDYSDEELYQAIDGIIQWKKDSSGSVGGEGLLTNKYLKDAGSSQGDWYPVSLGRLGVEDDYAAYLAAVNQNVEDRYQTEGKLDAVKATEWHRIALAILASGGDPTDVGDSHINLIADGVYDREKTMELGAQGVNGIIWGLITLDSLRYQVPEEASSSRQDIVQMLLESQLEDGGYSFGASEADPDITGMALTALAPYYNSEETYTYTQEAIGKEVTKTVRQVADECLEILSSMQMESGGFSSWESENSESVSQALLALSSLGIDAAADERFIKDGVTLLDVLMGFQMSDGGFIHSREYDEANKSADPNESNTLASEQALYALTAYMRLHEGMRSMFDCRPEMSEEVKNQVQSVGEAINQLSEDVQPDQAAAVYESYLKIPQEERCYVYNYGKLAEILGGAVSGDEQGFLSQAMGLHTSGKGAQTDIRNPEHILSTEVIFSEEDKREAEGIPQQVTTEYYIPVVKAIYKIEHSGSQQENQELLARLKEQKQEIIQRQQEIDSINQTIKEQISAVENIGLKEQKAVSALVQRYEALPEYEQGQIENYEDVSRADIKISSAIKAIVIGCMAAAAAAILLIFVMVRMRKRRRQSRNRKMLDWEEDDED